MLQGSGSLLEKETKTPSLREVEELFKMKDAGERNKKKKRKQRSRSLLYAAVLHGMKDTNLIALEVRSQLYVSLLATFQS